MASFKDRRISDLPTAPSVGEDSAFIVVNGINGKPYNQRVSTKILFENIPVPVQVGSELSGRDVTFHASDTPEHNFRFTQNSGDVIFGHDVTVSNDVSVNGNLRVFGTTLINNVTYETITVNQQLNSSGNALFLGTARFQELADFRDDLNVNKDLTVVGSTNIDEDLTVAGQTTLDDLVANNVTFLGNITYNTIAATSIETTEFVSTGLARFNTMSIDGNINVGTVFANVGTFDTIQVAQPSEFYAHVGAQDLKIRAHTDTDTLTVHKDQQILGSLEVTSEIKTDSLVTSSSQLGDISADNVSVSDNMSSNTVNAISGTIGDLHASLATSISVFSDMLVSEKILGTNGIIDTVETLSAIADTISFTDAAGKKLNADVINVRDISVPGTANVEIMLFKNITGENLTVTNFSTGNIITNSVTAEKVNADLIENDLLFGNQVNVTEVVTNTIQSQSSELTFAKIPTLEFSNACGNTIGSVVVEASSLVIAPNAHLDLIKNTTITTEHLSGNTVTSEKITTANTITTRLSAQIFDYVNASGNSLQAMTLQANNGIIPFLQTDLANILDVTSQVIHAGHTIVDVEDVEMLTANVANISTMIVDTMVTDGIVSNTVQANTATITELHTSNGEFNHINVGTSVFNEIISNEITTVDLTATNTSSVNYSGTNIEVDNVHAKLIETDDQIISDSLTVNEFISANTVEFNSTFSNELISNNFIFNTQTGNSATILEVSTNELNLSGYEITGIQSTNLLPDVKKVPTSKVVYDSIDSLDFTKITTTSGATLETNALGVLAHKGPSYEIFSADLMQFTIHAPSLFFKGYEIIDIDTVTIVDDARHIPSSTVVQTQFDLISDELNDLRGDLTSLDQIISKDTTSTVTVANTSITGIVSGVQRYAIDGVSNSFTIDTNKISLFGHTFEDVEQTLVGSAKAIPTANAVVQEFISANNALNSTKTALIHEISELRTDFTIDLNLANTNLTAAITTVANDLAAANNALSSDISTVESTLDTKIDNVEAALTASIQTANTTLHNRIDGLDLAFDTKLDALEDAYETVDSAIRSQIEDANTLFNAADSQIRLDIGLLNAKLNSTNTALVAKITTNETNIDTNRIDLGTANTTLHGRIDTVTADLQNANTYLQSLLGSSSSDFASANTILHGRIDAVELSLSTANSTLSSEIALLDADLLTVDTILTNSIGDVSARLASANTILHGRIDTFENDFATANTILHGRIDTANNEIVQTKLELSTANTNLNASISSVESDLGTANTTLHGRIDVLQTDLTNATAALNSTIGSLSSNTIVQGTTSIVTNASDAIIEVGGVQTTFSATEVRLSTDLEMLSNSIDVDVINANEVFVTDLYATNLLGITSIATNSLDTATITATGLVEVGELTAITGVAKITTEHLIANNATLETITNETFVGSSITANNVSANSGTIDVFETISISSESFSANNLTGNTGTLEILTSNNATVEVLTANNSIVETFSANDSTLETLTSNNATVETLTANNLNVETITANTYTANSITTDTLQLAGGEIRRTDDGHGNTIWEFI